MGCGGLLKLEMEASDKQGKGGCCPCDNVTQVNFLRVENEKGARKCVRSRERRSSGISSMKHLPTAVKSRKVVQTILMMSLAHDLQ